MSNAPNHCYPPYSSNNFFFCSCRSFCHFDFHIFSFLLFIFVLLSLFKIHVRTATALISTSFITRKYSYRKSCLTALVNPVTVQLVLVRLLSRYSNFVPRLISLKPEYLNSSLSNVSAPLATDLTDTSYDPNCIITEIKQQQKDMMDDEILLISKMLQGRC